MDKYQLYDLLDLEEASEFKYFENFADLMEADEHIDSDVLYELLSEINLDDFTEICNEYFEQTSDSIPDQETEFYTLFDNIKRSFCGMAKAAGVSENTEDRLNTLLKLADEIEKFRSWYVFSMNVESTSEYEDDTEMLSVRDALFQVRADKFLKKNHRYDFSSSLEYELEEYIMNFADLMTEDV